MSAEVKRLLGFYKNLNSRAVIATGFVCMTILLWSIAVVAAQPKVEKSTKNDDEAKSIIDKQKPIENKPESPPKRPSDEIPTPSLGKPLDPVILYANSKGAVATILTKDDLGFDNGQGSGFFIDPSLVKSLSEISKLGHSVAESTQKKPLKDSEPTPPDPKVLAYIQSAAYKNILSMLHHASSEDSLTQQKFEKEYPHQDYQDYLVVRNYFQKYSSTITQIWEQLHTAFFITNYHVIQSAAIAEVRLDNGESGSVKDVVMESKDLDLAIVSCIIGNSSKPVPTLQIAEGSKPTVGDKVYTIGSPKGLEASLSEGIISGKRELAPGISCLQTTAPISPGSSGGPLLNSAGEVIGVVKAYKYGGQNLNIAIPSSHIIELFKGPCNSRELWRGAGIQGELFNAYRLAADGTMGKVLMDAMEFGLIRKDKNEESFAKVLQSLTETPPSQFGEQEYLLHFTIGLIAHLRTAHSLPSNLLTKLNVDERHELLRMDKNQQLAKKSFLKSIELKPEFSPSYNSLSFCLYTEGRYGEALKIADILVKKVPNSSLAYKNRGDILIQLNRNMDAKRDFKIAAELGPGNPDIYVDIGNSCMFLRENDEAIQAYETALHLKVDRPELCYYHIGIIYERTGKFEQAIDSFNKAKENGFSLEECNKEILDCLRRLQ